MGITVVGSLNYDLVTYTERIPVAGETFNAESFETHSGGKGLNQAIALAKLVKPYSDDDSRSVQVRMVGHVGSDSFGKQLLDKLREHKIDTKHVDQVQGESTGVAVIVVEKSTGQNRILITAGANSHTVYSNEQLEKIFSNKDKEFVVFQHEIPNPQVIMDWLKHNRPNYEVVYNPSPFHKLEKKVWRNVDLLIVNEIEAMQIIESLDTEEIVSHFKSKITKENYASGYLEIAQHFQSQLISQDHSAVVIITLGEQGCVFCSKHCPEGGYVPSIKVEKVVDTTAAGDTFLGAVVSQLHDSQTLEDSIKFATTASSITITKKGAAETIPVYSNISKI